MLFLDISFLPLKLNLTTSELWFGQEQEEIAILYLHPRCIIVTR